MILLKCAACDSKNLRFFQRAKSYWIVKQLRIKNSFKSNSFSIIPLVCKVIK